MFRTPFFLDGPKKKRFRAAKEKGPPLRLQCERKTPGAVEHCYYMVVLSPACGVRGVAFGARLHFFGAPSRGAGRSVLPPRQVGFQRADKPPFGR